MRRSSSWPCAGRRLRPGGQVVVYAMNGANPMVGSENLSHNIDHFYHVTEYSLGQILQLAGFQQVRTVRVEAVCLLEESAELRRASRSLRRSRPIFRILFMLYGKKVKILSKKVAAVASA